ncbi:MULTISPECIES: non-ribosomal peptide synthetase [unclassified Nonomuraea]|uniref:non-ribosomal peptide synthetase n=1 Tax=unclassified Nonomuraea TaxID=2593643 RepID=UPI0013771E1F|nr:MULTISPECIES: non-ribosomal peptide synthetase [unclassified Nonomuraea]NBE96551.1 amino acid adenylation domain-containing protein [Nonomuraea sp. K271]
MATLTDTGVRASARQTRLWYLQHLHDAVASFSTGDALILDGPPREDRLRAAIAQLRLRHTELRSGFIASDGVIRMVPIDQPSPAVVVEEGEESAVRQWAAQAARIPFDIANGPLWRVRVLSLPDDRHAVMLVAHQLIADGFRVRDLLDELLTCYDGGVPEPGGDPVPAQESADAVEAATHRLASAPTGVELPADRLRPPVLSYRGGRVGADVEAPVLDRLGGEVALLAAFAVLAHRYTGSEEMVIAVHDEAVTVEGATNPLPVRIDLTGDPTFPTVLRRVRGAVEEARVHGAVPFEAVIGRLEREHDPSRRPVCQLAFSSSRRRRDAVEVDAGLALFDLALSARLHEHGASLTFDYDADLFTAQTVRRFGGNLVALLKSLAENPDVPISRQRILTDEESALIAGHQDGGPVAGTELVHRLIAEQAARRPHAQALVSESARLTFAELNGRANQIAHHLRDLGVRRQTPVGVCLPRSAEMVVAVLGVLKAGGAAVLLDPAQPARRLAMMLDDSRPLAVLTAEEQLGKLPGTYAGHIWCVDRDSDLLNRSSTGDPDEWAHPLSVCQIAYTSGSTGEPRGVAFNHAAVAKGALGTRQCYRLGEDDRGTWISAPGFGISFVNELWPFLTAGAAVHIAGERTVSTPFRLRDWLVECGVTVSLVTKALAERLCAVDWSEEVALRALLVSGERTGWLSSAVPFEVATIYGSTETTNATTCLNEAAGIRVTPKQVPERQRRSISSPIGLPVPGARVYVLDANLRVVPMGVPGEIHVGGDLLQSGYVNRPGLTAQKWLPDPYAGRAGARMVASGDIGRMLPDGSIEILGRVDDQISLNGYRVEPGEVAARLLEHPAVRHAAVVVREDEPGERRLVAYVVPEVNRRVHKSELLELLREQLPGYMVPGACELIDALPTLPNGKLDKRRLPAPDRGSRSVSYEEPATEVERELAAIWRSVLRTDTVGADDNYFELGGDSLTGMELMAAISAGFGVELALSVLFEAPTVREMSRAIERERDGDGAHAADKDALPVIRTDPASRYEPFPLTDIQHAYWIGRMTGMELGDVGCHGYQEWDVADLDVERLRIAIDRLVRRHDMLRAVVTGDGRQRVLPTAPPYEVEVTDLRRADASERAARLDEIRERLSHEVLAADRWPLFGVRVTRVDEVISRMHISFDLLIFDARSARVFTQELSRLYRDPDAPLPPIELSFRDYVLAERAARESSPLYRAAREYWDGRLAELPPAPELPYLRSLGSVDNPKFERHAGRIEADEWLRLRHAAAGAGITPSALLLAAFAEILATWSAGPRFTVNMTLFNRPPLHPQLNDLLGDFTSGVLHAVDHRGADFAERARDVQERLWHDLEHRHVGSVQVLRELGRRQGGAPRAAMPVVFSSLVGVPRMDWGNLGRYAFGVTQTPQVALDHQVMEVNGGLDYCWDAVAELFPAGLVGDMADAYGKLLRHLADSPNTWREPNPVRLPQATVERRGAANSTEAKVTAELLHEPFLRQAERTPDAAAVIDERVITYRQLADASSALAARVIDAGAGPEKPVAVVMRKGWEQVAAVLGVLRAGAAYLPIDPDLPTERIAYLLDNSRADFVLTQHGVDVPTAAEVITVPADPGALRPAPLPDCPARPDSLAYVIYTSGSTGRPKGVMIEHRAAWNTIADINDRVGLGADDRVLALSSLSFDLSVWDIFGLLAVGGAVVIPPASANPDPRAWADLVARERVTIWNSVPALWQILSDYLRGRGERVAPSLATVMLSGDWIPLTTYEHLAEISPGTRLISLGGATEAAIWSIAHEVGPAAPDWASVPYGRPLRNQRWHVLDGRLEPCPDWVTGSLFIAGDGLARGYWAQPELTDERFITHPRTGERLYRTGDLGRYHPSGDLELLGREDFQVKILGHRIELGEIETALAGHPQVAACCVVAVGERTAKRLIAHLVPEPGAAPDPAEIRQFLTGKLVRDVVPTHYNILTELPLTANGKVDRPALVALGAPERKSSGDALPASPAEAVLLDVAAEILGVDAFGPEEDFFAAGGDSLRAIAFINEAANAGFDIPVEAFFQYPTIRAAVDAGPVVVDMRGESA